MKQLDRDTQKKVHAGHLDPNMGTCYQTKADAIKALFGTEHYDVLEIARALHLSCPMEYPDMNMALQAAIEPFLINPQLL